MVATRAPLASIASGNTSPTNSSRLPTRGCTSQVWLVGERDGAGRFAFRGDSDAHIVKGLVALLLLLYGGRTPAEILALDARAELGKLDLEGHLSPSRANGLFAMVRRIRALAAAAG